MDGTTFNIVNNNDYKVYVEGKWYNTGDVVKTLVTKDGKATSDEDCLPYGTYTIQEVKSGEGYTLGDGVPREFSITEDGVILDTFTGDGAFTNTVIKGDVHLVKVAEIDQSRMANIVFKLTSLATGEVWTLTTDENGEAYTEGYALPYGKYKLEEIESKENEDYVMITLDEISISKDKTIVDLGTLVNKLRPDPTLSTTATDKADGDKVLALGGTQTVVDAVSFENLRTDRKYTMVGVLHYVNEDGSDGGEVEGSLNQVTFTPEAENGEVQVNLNVDTSDLEGKSIVVFEECRQHLVYEDEEADETVDETDTSLDVSADETDTIDETTDTKAESYRVVATHMDIADEGQTVSVETLPDAMPDTGDKTMQFAFGLLALSAFSLFVASRRKVRED